MEAIVGAGCKSPRPSRRISRSLQTPPENETLISEAEWGPSYGSLNGGDVDSATSTPDEKTKLVGGDSKAGIGNGDGGGGAAAGAAEGFLSEIPAIMVTLMINFMTAIPFGVAYFPLGWSNDYDSDLAGNGNSGDDDDDQDGIAGPFPLPGKEVLGIRMFLFACITGQIALALTSRFQSPVSVQLIENVPFYHAMASIVIAEQGYGTDALSTMFFLFGLSSIVTGLMFYGLGKAGLGKVVYYFPSHVLVGFIGGIGVFIACSSTGVVTGADFEFSVDGVRALAANFGRFAPALAFEVALRILMAVLVDENGKPKYTLLAPVFFLSIVPMYYVALYICGVSMQEATEAGYFFPASVSQMEGDGDIVDPSFLSSVFDGHILDMFRAVDIRTVSWPAVLQSLTTVVGMSCFSVINVPINIPAFANACNVDVDMNQELLAHGYSNLLTGLFGGIQNVMTYSVSVLYYKSGGRSRAAQCALVLGTVLVFVFGVVTMPYIPRCMAGTLLLHIGVDLFMEGVYESYQEYDYIEYTGILAITLVMTFLGMTPALIAGIIVAMTTYAVQSVQHLDPIFKITTASTLRSSAWTRPPEALAILNSPTTGRSRIMVIQLQGNVFFGNAVDMVDTIKEALAKDTPLVVMLDFTLVVSMDSSAAQAVAKLKNAMPTWNIFVMGSHRGYFPCKYELSTAILEGGGDAGRAGDDEESNIKDVLKRIAKNQVCVDFDEALVFAEDILITREDPSLLQKDNRLVHLHEDKNEDLTQEEEKDLATHYLQNLVRPDPSSDEKRDAIVFLSYFEREVYSKKELVWKHGAKSDSAKLIVTGNLVASMEGTGVSEEIPRGVVIGELGLIDGVERLSTVVCESDRAVVFSLNKDKWERLVRNDPAVARILDHIAIRYLSHRVQHVSNRIYETRCLPV